MLGLIRENRGVAARALDRMGLSRNAIRAEIERQATRGPGITEHNMEFAPAANRVIDLVYDEARQLSNDYVDTEHLLLGLIRDGEGLAGKVLAQQGADLAQARRFARELQSGQNLLRAASVSDTPVETLLRVPQSGVETTPEELLRTSQPPTSDVEPARAAHSSPRRWWWGRGKRT